MEYSTPHVAEIWSTQNQKANSFDAKIIIDMIVSH